ncbi:hypothetical protein [Proteiniphilum sp.]|uniref:hypothetical protein n=1 Tax=Proteiniphilum sp. TaxID=1926877 RepID=UPI00331B6399
MTDILVAVNLYSTDDERESTQDITIHIPRDSAKSFDFHKAEELIEIGRSEARKSLGLYRENHTTYQIEKNPTLV